MSDMDNPPNGPRVLRKQRRPSTNLFKVTMNRFLNKKKAPEPANLNNDTLNALSAPAPTSPTLKKSKTSRWKKGKQPPAEPKPEVNYSAALPDTDDFRTSLLMPNLSARFSMLREQDDPNSKLGKASDDSVLQPRRRSRMMDLGFGSSNGLGDIAEVASMKSSIRPPFATNDRADSCGSGDGYGTDDESHGGGMMARSRPGEGNNLFGGRQKVYRIPTTGAASTRSLGKAVYEDDVGMSAFQKHKLREKERLERERLGLEEARGSEDGQTFDFGDLGQATPGDQDDRSTPTFHDSVNDLPHSPSFSSREPKRSTSSTGHSDDRSSTAATSVASQSTNLPAMAAAPIAQAISPTPAPAALERSGTKSRKLYEPALDQYHQDQQASALTRFNSISRIRPQGQKPPPFLQTAKSHGNLQERSPQNVVALSKSQSPPPLAPLATLRNVSNGGSPITSGPSSPLSPALAHFEEDTVLNQALEPGDRGKATAMGAFNKPQQAFDETQYLERQRQLQRAVSNSTSGQGSVTSPAPSALQQRMGRFEQERERSSPAVSERERSPLASKTPEPSKAFNVFQNGATQIRNTTTTTIPQYDKAALPDTHRTFFGNISASDSEDDDDDNAARMDQSYTTTSDYGSGASGYGRWQPSVLPSVSEHPALRPQKSKASLAEEDELEYEAQNNYVKERPLTPAALPVQQEVVVSCINSAPEHDSPTLPMGAAPLNGMMHHLRQESNQSSIYPATEVNAEGEVQCQHKGQGFHTSGSSNTYDSGSQSRVDSTYANSNPWDLDDLDAGYYGNNDAYQISNSPTGGGRARAPSNTSHPGSKLNGHSDRTSEASQASGGQDWQRELRRGGHNRDASTATQQERDAFANELAQRQRAIQENLKSIAEGGSQSRGTSPTPSTSGASKAFGMLRMKSSRDSFAEKRNEPPASSKAMKMLGLGAPASNPNLASQYERSGYSFESGRPRGNSVSRSSPALAQQRSFGHEQSRSRADSETSRFAQHPATRPPSAQGPRSRSNSTATNGRSQSRVGRYHEDSSPGEGAGMNGSGQPVSRELTPGPSPEMQQSPFEQQQQQQQNRTRSNSRTGPLNGYFEAKPSAIHPANRVGPSPPTASPYNPTTASTWSPFTSQTATPPLSTTNTPTTTHRSNFPSTPPQPTPSQISSAASRPQGPLARKKTVSKTDISVPTLVHATSNIDTVDLPEGASLRNGMEEIASEEQQKGQTPPPVPPMSSKRRGTGTRGRILGVLRRGDSGSEGGEGDRDRDRGRAQGSGWDVSTQPQGWDAVLRSRTPEPWQVSGGGGGEGVVSPLKEGGFAHARTVQPLHRGFDSSAVSGFVGQNGYGYAAHISAGSPERMERGPHPQQQSGQPVALEGGMF